MSDVLLVGLGALACVGLARACRRTWGPRNAGPRDVRRDSSALQGKANGTPERQYTPRTARPAKAPLCRRARTCLRHNQVWFTTVGSVCLALASGVVGWHANRLAGQANQLLAGQKRVMEAQLRPEFGVRREMIEGSEKVLVSKRGGYIDDLQCELYAYLAFRLRDAAGRTEGRVYCFTVAGYYSSQTPTGDTEGVVFMAMADSAAGRELARRVDSITGVDVPAVGPRPAGTLVQAAGGRGAYTWVVVRYTDAFGQCQTWTRALRPGEGASSTGELPLGHYVPGSPGPLPGTPPPMMPVIPLERLSAATIRERYVAAPW